MSGRDDQQRVDALREQLRSLGYLDARVDRFVLGGAATRERPAALALAASARIGLLAGVLLGPAAAIGLRLRAPQLVTSASDAVVFALYLAVVFGVAAAAGAALAVVIAGAIARRAASRPGFATHARRVATMAGLAVGVGCLAYLSMWWRTAAGLAGATSTASTIVVLAVAVSISLLLGHAVTVTVLAWLARAGFGASMSRGLPLSSWKAQLPLGAIALAGATAILIFSRPDLPALAPPQITVVPTGQRLLVLAIDGVDLATLERLRAAGRTPALARLLSGSAATLTSDTDRDPARVWTTIATGQPPDRHGVRALESRQVAGVQGRLTSTSPAWATLTAATDLLRLTRPSIASGDERLLPTFWEVAARAGLRTAVVHWWATWPAPANLGTVISDRAILRLEHGGAANDEIAPAALYATLEQTSGTRRDAARARAAAAVLAGASPETTAAIRRSAELDATIVSLARDPALGDLDVLVVYLPGLDIAQHAIFSSTADGLAPSDAAARGAAIERYYEYLDSLTADLIANAATGWTVALVTQPGRVSQPGDGLLALSGAPASTARTAAPVVAVAPTLLQAIGVPIARDLAGRPAGLFTTAFVRDHVVTEIATYGVRTAPNRPGGGKPLDKEMIERMRSLGYVR